MLERNLGVRLFHRSTRKLTLTDSGERFLLAIKDNLEGLQQAISGMATDAGEPAGVLKVSMGLNFGADYILPLLPAFLARYPGIRPDWQFTTRQIDLIAEGYDAAIGGGIEWGRASSRARLRRCISSRWPRRNISRTARRLPTPPGLRRSTELLRSSRTGGFANERCATPLALKSL